ncbi:MAG: pseudouridine synthase [Gemmatimonadota bacterium]
MADGIRLQKYLSRAGRASRREAERIIRAGRVQVNGNVVTELGTRVVPGRDTVALDGARVDLPEVRWLAYHKPAGVLTTRGDPHGGRTVYDMLPPDVAGLRYVGRLDRETTGLLLLTNDGDVAHALLHPSGEVEREYRVVVSREPDPSTLAALRSGVELEDGPARVRRVWVEGRGGGGVALGVVLTEGRKREVRRLFRVVGNPVKELARVRFGPIELGALAPGAWRELTEDERRRLRERAARGDGTGDIDGTA